MLATQMLQHAARAQGLEPGPAKPRRGRPGITLHCLRPEPVTLRTDATGRLLLEDFLPFVLPGGRLHRRIKTWLAEYHPDALCISRRGNLSIGLPSADLAALLALAGGLRAMLDAEWPDYANGVFAAPLS